MTELTTKLFPKHNNNNTQLNRMLIWQPNVHSSK